MNDPIPRFKVAQLPLLMLLGTTAGAFSETNAPGNTVYPPTPIEIQTAHGRTNGWAQIAALSGFMGGLPHHVNYIHTAYLPATGHGWAGMGFGWGDNLDNTRLALVDGCLVGLFHETLSYGGRLHLTVSESRHAVGETNLAMILKREREAFLGSSQPLLFGPPHELLLVNLLPPAAIRELEDPALYKDFPVYSSFVRTSRLTNVEVLGTNLVVTVEFGTNVVAEIALDKAVHPVWVKTNGVSIGAIPTNTVFFREIRDNRTVVRTVY